ncbi:hypothetical protein D3C76_1238860 [compost metagenome]
MVQGFLGLLATAISVLDRHDSLIQVVVGLPELRGDLVLCCAGLFSVERTGFQVLGQRLDVAIGPGREQRLGGFCRSQHLGMGLDDSGMAHAAEGREAPLTVGVRLEVPLEPVAFLAEDCA